MNPIQTTKYAVHVSQSTTNGTQRWQATVEALPQIMVEAETCVAVLEEVGRKLQETIAADENGKAVIRREIAAVPPLQLAELEAQVQAQGHKFYGIFANDPGALELFDEIEKQREQHPLAK